MNLPEKPPTQFDLRTPPIHPSSSTAKRMSSRSVLRFAAAVAIAGAILCIPAASPVLAKTAHQADSKADSAIDPDAMAALDKMGAYLRTLKSFQVRADVATDRVLDDGQTIQFSSKVDIVIARPNRMRVEVTDDDGHRFFFFDGKNSPSTDRSSASTLPFPPQQPSLN